MTKTASAVLASFLALSLSSFSAQAAWPEDRPIEFWSPMPPVAAPMSWRARCSPIWRSAWREDRHRQPPRRGGRDRLHHAEQGETRWLHLRLHQYPGFLSTRVQRKVGYDPAKIRPVARIVDDPTVLAVPKDSSYQTLADFTAAAKAAPGKFSVGTLRRRDG